MDFYESISTHYDLIFPVDPETVDFIDRRTKPCSRILDIACGTGGYSLALAGKGHRLTGIDLDRGMIEAARAKAQGLDLNTVFQVMDMLEMVENLDPGFNLAFCIGNSLVHLESEEKIQQALFDCNRLLRPGGMLIVQIINYDRILAKGITSLPTLRDESAELEFVRIYELNPAKNMVIFQTELSIGKEPDQRVIRNQVPLRILMSADFLGLAVSAGFQDLQLFGGFDEKPFGIDTLPLILCGYKS
jgi:SAM-dependent methyltransferase